MDVKKVIGAAIGVAIAICTMTGDLFPSLVIEYTSFDYMKKCQKILTFPPCCHILKMSKEFDISHKKTA